MKKILSLFTAICLITLCVPQCVSATEIAEDPVVYAAIVDENGKVVETLQVEAVETEVNSNQRSNGITRSETYTARSTSDTSDPKDGITATLTISWNDFLGIDNQLISVSGSWSVGDETINSRAVVYSAYALGGTQLQSLSKTPTSNSFVYEPTNFTGYRFALASAAVISSTGNTISFSVST